MLRVLFIDRDGTLIVEPPCDKQVDSLEKLSFIPSVFCGLSKIAGSLPYELVMVTNQDGLGTASFPEKSFVPPHQKMLDSFLAEGIEFSEILIDRSLPKDNAPTRKPRTGLVEHYRNGRFDLSRSFVIGDRLTDLEFATNLETNAVYFSEEQAPTGYSPLLTTTSWERIYRFLLAFERQATVTRKTAETEIHLTLSLDGSGQATVSTGIGFFDHMLEQIARHSGCNLEIAVRGDLHVDEHHTVEDTALVLGEAVSRALGDKRGISRFSFVLPMDESRALVALDFSGRPWFTWEAEFRRERVGELPTELFSHFFKSFSDTARCTLQIQATGANEHHKIEAIFKGFARCLKEAWQISGDQLPSTKGVL